MAMIENDGKWPQFTSTGTGKAINFRGYAQGLTFGFEPSTNSTATIQILHRMGSSGGPYSVLSTIQCASTGEFVTAQFLGPLQWVKPRVVDKTAGGTTNTVDIYFLGN